MKKDTTEPIMDPAPSKETYFKHSNPDLPYHHHSSSFFWPLLLITIGTLLLFNNLNLLPWEIWETLVKFWPLIFILMGLEMLLGKGKLANLIVTLIGLLVLFTILGIYVPGIGDLITRSLPALNFPQIQHLFNR